MRNAIVLAVLQALKLIYTGNYDQIRKKSEQVAIMRNADVLAVLQVSN